MTDSTLPCELVQAGSWKVLERAPGGLPVELADAFPKYKAAINVLPGAEPSWSEVIQRAVPLLALHSKDLSVASELAVALWMDRRFVGLQDALTIWLDLLSDPIWPEVWPRAKPDRAAQLQRFLMRVEAHLREPSQRSGRHGERAAQELVVESLRLLESEAARQLGGVSCTDDIRKLRRAIVDLSGSASAPSTQSAPAGSSAEQVTGQLVSAREELIETLAGPVSLEVCEPWWSALQAPLWQVLRAVVGAWPGLPSAWRLARALAWCIEPVPQSARGVITADARVAQDLAERAARLPQLGGAAPWIDLEVIWQERGHVRWLDPHRVAADRLRRGGHEASALAVERMTAMWLDRAKGLAELRMDDEGRTRLADDTTRRWAARLAPPSVQDAPVPASPAPTYNSVTLTKATERLRKEVRSALAKSGDSSPASPADIVAAIGVLRAPVDALVQLLCALHPSSFITGNFCLAWSSLVEAVPALAQGEKSPGGAPLSPPGEDVISELEQEGVDPAARVGFLWDTIRVFPWWLDLYRALAECLPQVGGHAAAAVVADIAEEATLVWPNLLDLRFADGRPLADDATRAWLRSLSGRAQPGASTAANDPLPPATPPPAAERALGDSARPAPDFRSIEEGSDPWALGLQALAEGRIREGLLTLEQVAQQTRGGRQRFEGALRVADALLNVGEHAAAEAILSALDDQARQHDLDRWDPTLAEAVTRACWRLETLIASTPNPSSTTISNAALLRRSALQGLYGLLIPQEST